MINSKPDLVLAETVRNVLKKASSLEKKGKLEKALQVLETVSNEIHNPSLPIANSIIIEIASICNKLFNRGGNDVLILRKAEMVLNHWKILNKHKSDMDSEIFNLMLLTLNNWATYHQISHNYHMSLNYLMRAQKFMDEFQLNDPDSLEISAKTKLNICALYFELRRYKETIDFAKQALAILQLELRGRLADSTYEELDEEEQLKVQVMASSYVIAFYNIGAAHEALGNHIRMLEAFDNAVKIGIEFLPHDHELLSAAYVAKTEAQTLVKQFPSRPTTKATTARESKRVVLTQKKSEDNQMLRCSTTPDLHKRSKSSRFPRINLQAPPSATLPLTERKEEVKYYSDKQLLRLQKKLQESQPKFVSADQYFYNKISKNLNISRDIKYLKELNASEAHGIREQEKEEKRKLVELRLRKYSSKRKLDSRGQDYMMMQIERLRTEDELLAKKLSVQMKSKLKTKVYKKLVRSISSPRKRKSEFPPQRLFFKPPELMSNERDNRIIRLNTGESEFISNEDEMRIRKENFQLAKDEIETLMDCLNEEMKRIDEAQSGIHHKIQREQKMLQTEPSLARSTLKSFTKNTSLAFLSFEDM